MNAFTPLDRRGERMLIDMAEQAGRTGPDRYFEINQRATRQRISDLRQERHWAKENDPARVEGLTVSIDYLVGTISAPQGVPGWLQIERERAAASLARKQEAL